MKKNNLRSWHTGLLRGGPTPYLPYGRRLMKYVVFAGMVWLLLILVFGNNGLMAFFALKREVRKTKVSISGLKKELVMIQANEKSIVSDKKKCEAILREEYRYAEPGEIVFEFVKPE